MKNKNMVKLVAALAVLGISHSASAILIIMEPDDFANGTDVSLAWAGSGITMSSYFNSESNPPTLTRGWCIRNRRTRAVTGVRSFGSTPTSGSFFNVNDSQACMSGAVACPPLGLAQTFLVLRVDFARPVDFVEVYGGFGIDPIGLYAMNSANEIIATCFGFYTPGCFTTLGSNSEWTFGSSSITRASRDITSVIIGGSIGNSGVDTIRANVPEPGTFALFGAGLLLALGFRRTRRSQAACADASSVRFTASMPSVII